jgi:hypothetical protein
MFIVGVSAYETLKYIAVKRNHNKVSQIALPLFGALISTAFIIPHLKSDFYRSNLQNVLKNSLKITIPLIIGIGVPFTFTWKLHSRFSSSTDQRESTKKFKQKVTALGVFAVCASVPLTMRYFLKKYPINSLNPRELVGPILTCAAASFLTFELTKPKHLARKVSTCVSGFLGIGMFVGLTSHFTGRSY